MPALDGVRGLAILLVILHHGISVDRLNRFDTWIYNLADSAWVGVDLFFVLSGFLITGILLDARASRGYFRNFYARRILRIFPLYYLALLLLFWVYRPLVASGDQSLRHLSDEQVWYWAYLSNFLVAGTGRWPEAAPFIHFWSLAVEEQFYLVWPAIVFLLKPRHLKSACLACIFGAFTLRLLLVFSGASPISIYVSTACRIDALALGALVALVMREGPAGRHLLRHIKNLGWVALIILILQFAIFDGMRMRYAFSVEGQSAVHTMVMMTVGMSATCVLFASLLVRLLQAHRDHFLQRAFTTPGLLQLGKYSYCIYVVHWPLMLGFEKFGLTAGAYPEVFSSQLPGQIVTWLLLLIGSFGIAFISWHAFESHILRLKKYFDYESGAAGIYAPAGRKRSTPEGQRRRRPPRLSLLPPDRKSAHKQVRG